MLETANGEDERLITDLSINDMIPLECIPRTRHSIDFNAQIRCACAYLPVAAGVVATPDLQCKYPPTPPRISSFRSVSCSVLPLRGRPGSRKLARDHTRPLPAPACTFPAVQPAIRPKSPPHLGEGEKKKNHRRKAGATYIHPACLHSNESLALLKILRPIQPATAHSRLKLKRDPWHDSRIIPHIPLPRLVN